jgi:uncharacterized repeat protein (TIGR02543 family)
MEKKRFLRRFMSVFLSFSLVLGLLAATPKLTVFADPPNFSVTNQTLTGAKEDTPYNFSYSNLGISLSDPDGDPASVIIQSIDSGTLRYEGQVLKANDRLPYGQITWIPEPNRNGLITAFTLVAYDDWEYSAPVKVKISVSSDNKNPTGRPAITGNAVVGQTLTADTSEIADADGIGPFTYEWGIYDGLLIKQIPSATNSTYTPTSDDAGKYLILQVRYTDGGGRMETITSVHVLCEAAPPETDPGLAALKNAIETYYSGEGYLEAEIDEENKTVTVTGRVTFASSSLLLDIPKGVTVIWNAEILADDEYDLKLLKLTGNGSFEVSEEGMIYVNEGIGIYAEADVASVSVRGGTVYSGHGFGISTTGSTEIEVQSGKVIGGERGINALGTNSVIRVSGGLITSDDRIAILAHGSNATINLSGGTLVSRTNSARNVVNTNNPNGLTISGDTAIIAWNKGAGKTSYTAGTKEDLDHIPEGLSVVWAENDDNYGITYTNGNNSGFYYVKGVVVNKAPATVTALYVSSAPIKSTYFEGDSLDLSGLTVNLIKSDGSVETVSFKDFAANNITTSPVNGSVLDTTDSVVTITYTPTNKSDYLELNMNHTYSVTVTNNGHGTGSASSTKAPIGTEITLTATPDPGYHFARWEVISGGITITDNLFRISDEAVTVRAIFEADETASYTVTFMDKDTIYAVRTVQAGESISNADWPERPVMKDYLFTGWYFGLYNTGDEFTPDYAVNQNLTVYASWFFSNIPDPGGNNGGNEGENNHSITVLNNGNGVARPNPATAVSGAAITLFISPAEGYRLSHWEVISPSDLVIADNRFTMPDTDVTVRAVFVSNDAAKY